MSDIPDIPPLRCMSAERLVEGDVLWGVVNDPADQRKGWATLGAEPQIVTGAQRFSDGDGMTVRVTDGDGEHNLGLLRQTQVLIEFKGATMPHLDIVEPGNG